MKDLILRISLLDNAFFTGIKVVLRSENTVKMDAFREWIRVSGLDLLVDDYGVAMVVVGIMDSRDKALDVCKDIQLLLEGQEEFIDVDTVKGWKPSTRAVFGKHNKGFDNALEHIGSAFVPQPPIVKEQHH